MQTAILFRILYLVILENSHKENKQENLKNLLICV